MCTRSIKIKFPSINSMIAFANASTRSKCRVMVKAGRISMDGKSIMNLFMLDITKKVKVKITGDRKDVERSKGAIPQCSD